MMAPNVSSPTGTVVRGRPDTDELPACQGFADG